tara:strand:- start:4132 stop:5253 length:1122 start_codon:yes stop_codon:yes gene_type:complete
MDLCLRAHWLAALFFFCLPLANGQEIEEPFLALQNRLVDVFARNEPAIVRVKAAIILKGKEGKPDKKTLRVGTGFFVSREGHVLTSDLVREAGRIWVEHHQDFYLAEVVGRDAIANIALLKLTDKKPSKFSFLRVAELPVLPPPGTFVMTLSAPLQFPPSPAMGIVQGHESNFGNRLFPARMLRTSVSVGPGEVGAPMLDLNGRFIGMVFASLPDLRSSCVLPASAVLRVRDDLLFSGKVSYAWFGLTVSSMIVDGGLRVQVDEILEDSPVAGSGIRKGDLLLKIGDHRVERRGDVATASFFARPGQFVNFLVQRGSEELEIPVRVSGRPIKSPPDSSVAELQSPVPVEQNSSIAPSVPIPESKEVEAPAQEL